MEFSVEGVMVQNLWQSDNGRVRFELHGVGNDAGSYKMEGGPEMAKLPEGSVITMSGRIAGSFWGRERQQSLTLVGTPTVQVHTVELN